MACFLVPAAEAVVTTAAAKILKTKDIPFSEDMGRLSKLLWGGSGLLAFEHLWHGEIVPEFPFFTADTSVIFHEMGTVGIAMSALVTAVWLCMTVLLKKRRGAKSAGEGAL